MSQQGSQKTERQDEPVITLRAASGWAFPDFTELWNYRELLYFFVLRDIKVRYRQTILGALWAVIQPFALAAAFWLVFDEIAGVDTSGVPYPVFAYTALVPWTLFSQSLTHGSVSLVGGAGLISKVYFPRMIVPLSASASFLLDFLIGVAILAVAIVLYGVTPSAAIVFLPLFSLMAFLCGFSIVLWLSALNVRYRDIRYAVPFLLQFLLFASPLGYSAAKVEGAGRWAFALNPVTGIAEGFRWAALGVPRPPLLYLIVPTIGTAVLLVSGLLYFHKTERTFADIV
jgi:lipopolysaccharide transport system permease protein